MTRGRWGTLAGALVALAMLAEAPHSASAASAARERAALAMLAFVGGPGPVLPSRQPVPPVPLTPDPFMAVDAWRAGGVRVDRSQADVRQLEKGCAVARTPDGGQPGPDPQPGDYLLYDSSLVDPTTPAVHPRRVAFFVTPVEVVYWDDARQLVQRTMAVRLLPSHRPGAGEARLVANSSTDEICRLPAAAWPGGEGSSRWRYALADPGYVAVQHQWAAEHPRDADTSPLHPVAVVITSVVAAVSSLLSQAVGAVQVAAGWALARLGVPGSALLGVLGLLGTEFDGRRAHRFLTGVLLLPASVFDPGLARVAVGLLSGLSPRELHVGRAGAWTRLLVGGAGLAVDTLTGIEDSRNVRAGMVLFALASDLLVFGKLAAVGRVAAAGVRRVGPMALAALPAGGRATLEAGIQRGLLSVRPARPWLRDAAAGAQRRGLRLLDLAGDTGDLVAVRPQVALRVLRWPGRALQAARNLQVTGGAPRPTELVVRLLRAPAHPGGHALRGGLDGVPRPMARTPEPPLGRAEGMRSLGRVAGDALSWVWRGHSATNDVIGHLGRYSDYADGALRAGGRSWGVRTLHAGWLPLQRRFPEAAARVAHTATTRGVPGVVRGARLVHLNSEAHTAMRLLAGQPPPPVSAPRAPALLHLALATEVRRAAELRAALGRMPGR